MKAKRNRYDLSLWDVRKLSLYGSASESVQAATLLGQICSSNLAGFKSRPINRQDHHNLRLLHWDGLDNSTSTKTE